MPAEATDGELYRSDAYWDKHPTHFAEHAAWKLTKLIPLVDQWASSLADRTKPVRLLDVGGGAGLLLRDVAQHLRQTHGLTVEKWALELSPAALAQQRRHNPDLARAWREDLAAMSLPDHSVDLTLLIDVLEHIEQPAQALSQLRRVADYVIIKAPLEDHAVYRLSNLLNRGQTRRAHRDDLGHVNLYTAGRLRRQLRAHLGDIQAWSYANAYAFAGGGERPEPSRLVRAVRRFCRCLHRVCPRAATWLFTDFALALVRCRRP